MNGRNFIIVADSLLQESSEEAWRSAVSRAYYALFHVARDLVMSLGINVPNADRAHGFLWLRLSNAGNQQVQVAGRALKDLRGDRNYADYQVSKALDRATAINQVAKAKLLFQIFDAAGLEPIRSTITDAIRIYERDVLKDVTWHP